MFNLKDARISYLDSIEGYAVIVWIEQIVESEFSLEETFIVFSQIKEGLVGYLKIEAYSKCISIYNLEVDESLDEVGITILGKDGER